MPADRDHKAKPGDHRRELDEFWDIDRLLPDRPARKVPPQRPASPTAVEIEILPQGSDRAAAKETVVAAPLTLTSSAGARSASPEHSGTRFVPPHQNAEPEAPLLDYTPDGVLLHRVQVFGWQSNYHYFDQFERDARYYATVTPPESARPEGFFSYFPQYVQLGRRQMAWYLWWREQVRNATYPDTDYAYVMLYLFELINLPAEDAAIARTYRDQMAGVWIAYRRTYPQLDHYMCEWLCDYCLIHALPAPLDILHPALNDIIAGSRLKEFYLVSMVGGEGRDLETARILMRHCCQYDYRKSKFAQGEHKALFDRTIPRAIAAVLPLLLGSGEQKPIITMQDSTVMRDAFTGALCTYPNKRRIAVSYTSFSNSHELRFLMGDMVKHVENRLRGWIGVRSRLSAMSLPVPLRDALDAYLAPLAPAKTPPPQKKAEPRPAYESLYDLPQKPLSLADAAAIESSSWETTRILTEAFEGEGTTPDAPPAPTADELLPVQAGASEAPLDAVDALPAFGSPLASTLEDYRSFLKAALAGDRAAQRAAAESLRKMPDAIADAINAITADSEIGDMVLEDDGTGFYAVIDDYRAMLEL